jgi:DNA-directed RNA polymerase specialized sigma24 family protein
MADSNDSPDIGTAQWQALDDRFRKPLMAYFLRRVGDRSEAEDLTQEVFVRLTRHPDRPSGDGAEAYVFMIASNLLKDRGRHQLSRKVSAHKSLSDVSENIATPKIWLRIGRPSAFSLHERRCRK